jgi:3-hydroxyisobutyrate dehydrogenase
VLTVAVLGTGTMGAPMARNLLKAGCAVRAWNRSREKAKPLAGEGAVVTSTPAEAAEGADVVLTMVADADVLEAVAAGPDGFLERVGDGAVWLQMSTIGVAGIRRAAELASDRGVELVDAPVLGTKEPAERGELLVLAAGEDEAVSRCEPVFEAVGAKTVRLGAVGEASRLKLVLNTWLLALVDGLAETLALAEGLGLDPRLFLETIAGGPLDVAYAQLKGEAMLKQEFAPSFPARLALKDATLVLEAAHEAGGELPLVDAVRERFERLVEAGYGDEDMAAVYRVERPG